MSLKAHPGLLQNPSLAKGRQRQGKVVIPGLLCPPCSSRQAPEPRSQRFIPVGWIELGSLPQVQPVPQHRGDPAGGRGHPAAGLAARGPGAPQSSLQLPGRTCQHRTHGWGAAANIWVEDLGGLGHVQVTQDSSTSAQQGWHRQFPDFYAESHPPVLHRSLSVSDSSPLGAEISGQT